MSHHQRSHLLRNLVITLTTFMMVAACGDPKLINRYNQGDWDPTIVNGSGSSGSEPWARHVVSLAIPGRPFCTGTILNQQAVVTAAHCIDFLKGQGGQGSIHFGVNGARPNHQRQIVRYRQHEGWNPQRSQGQDTKDIAVVHFSGGVPQGFDPAPLLKDESALRNGAEVLLAGYGVTSGTQKQGAGALRFTTVPIRQTVGRTEIMTDHSRSGSCYGDSGGPAFIQVQNTFYLWGITSRGDGACVNHGIYTKTTAYQQWIDQIAGDTESGGGGGPGYPPGGGHPPGQADGGGVGQPPGGKPPEQPKPRPEPSPEPEENEDPPAPPETPPAPKTKPGGGGRPSSQPNPGWPPRPPADIPNVPGNPDKG